MTDLPLAEPVAARDWALPLLRLPRLNPFPALACLLEAYARALDLAYVQPYLGAASGPRILRDGSEDGRNPEW